MSADGGGQYGAFNTKRKQVLNYVGGPGNILHNPYLDEKNSEDVEMKEKGVEAGGEVKEASKHKCLIVTVLCLVNLTANSAYSSIAPFYPAEALAKGVPEACFGFIFAGYSISMCVFAPLFSHMLSKYGRKRVLILGCLCESIAMICFGLFIYIEDPLAYALLSFLCRFVEGFGNGCLNSSTNAIIAFNFEDEMSKLIGIT